MQETEREKYLQNTIHELNRKVEKLELVCKPSLNSGEVWKMNERLAKKTSTDEVYEDLILIWYKWFNTNQLLEATNDKLHIAEDKINKLKYEIIEKDIENYNTINQIIKDLNKIKRN